MKRRTILVNISIVAAVVVIAALQVSDRETRKDANRPGDLADANNRPVDFTSFRGKVVFVNNWATWCPPCVAEMRSIQQLKDKLRDENIIFVMVSYDEERDKALSFMKKRRFTLDVYFPGTMYPYESSSLPTTFIIDKQGNVVREHVGMTDYSSEEMVNELRSLAK